MESSASSYREIALPASVLKALRRGLAEEAGSLPAIHVLHAAGYRSGAEAVTAFRKTPGEDLGALPEDAFWSRLALFLRERGWGTAVRSDPHPGVGLLASEDWAESAGEEHDAEASCSFTTGFLSGLLTRVAGGPIAVLEVECRGRGDGRCAFAFGSEAAIHELYGNLMESTDLNTALARL